MFERKSINRRRKAAITRREKRQRLRRRCLRAETLESRQLLAGEITPTVIQIGAEATVLLEVDQSHQGDIHMRTDPVNGQVQYGVDGATWESISDDFSGMDSVEFNWVYSTAGGLLTDFGFGNFNPLKIDEFSLPGVDVSISAPRIIVLPGVAVSTATPIGASGDLTFKSPLFSASVGSSLVTDSVTDTDVAGDLTIRAHAGPSAIQSFFTGTLPLTPKITTSEATVSLSGTTVRAGDVIIDADADSSDLYDDQDEENENKFGPQVIESTSELIGSLQLYVGYAQSKATSAVTIDGGTIDSHSLDVTSDAITQSTTYVLGAKGVTAGLTISEPNAGIHVKGDASISASGDVRLASHADSNASLTTITRTKKRGGTVAVTITELHSNASVASGSTINAGGSVSVNADGTKRQYVSGRASGFRGSQTALGAVYSQAVTHVTAAIDGTVEAVGDVLVSSQLDTPLNDLLGVTNTGISGVSGKIVNKITNANSGLLGLRGLVRKITGDTSALRASRTTNSLSGSFVVGRRTGSGTSTRVPRRRK